MRRRCLSASDHRKSRRPRSRAARPATGVSPAHLRPGHGSYLHHLFDELQRRNITLSIIVMTGHTDSAVSTPVFGRRTLGLLQKTIHYQRFARTAGTVARDDNIAKMLTIVS